MSLRMTERTARKEHCCIWCSGTVAVGERHLEHAWMFEGEFMNGRAHRDCQALVTKYAGTLDDGEGIPQFVDWEDAEAFLKPEDLAEFRRLLARGQEQQRTALLRAKRDEVKT